MIALLALVGCVSSSYETRDTSAIAPAPAIQSFQVRANADVCTLEGKPIIRLYSTTVCPHCRWINSTFNGVMDEYVKAGKIVAMHWDVDIGNNQFTPARETKVPQEEVTLMDDFNPGLSVPTFVFGCKYYRVGNAFETQDNLDAEAAEFKAVIEKLLKEVEAPQV